MPPPTPHLSLTVPTILLSHLATSEPSLVLLPEILYKISVPKAVGLQLVANYRPLLAKYSSSDSIFSQVAKGAAQGGNVKNKELGFTQEALDDTEKLKHCYVTRTNYASADASEIPSAKDPWLLVGILSGQAITNLDQFTNAKKARAFAFPIVSTICRVINITNDKSNSANMILWIKAFARGKVTEPLKLQSQIKSGPNKCYLSILTDIYFNDLFVTDVATEQGLTLSNDQFFEIFDNFVVETSLLFDSIDEFKSSYRGSLQTSNNFNYFQLLLRLSPLASVLFNLLEKDESLDKVSDIYESVFNDIKIESPPNAESQELVVSVKGKKYTLTHHSSLIFELLKNKKRNRVTKINATDKTKMYILMSIIRLYDLIISLLPISSAEKYRILSEVDFATRIHYHAPDCLREFNYILTSFRSSYEFIMKDFVEHGHKADKLKVVLNHLTTLKFVMENVNKNKKIEKGTLPAGRTISSPVSLAENNHNNDFDPDKEQDESIKKLKQFYKLLIAKDSPIEITFDGEKLVRKDFERCFKMAKSPMAKNSSEFQVLQNYLDIVVDLPWSVDESANKIVNLKSAAQKLDDDHYGLQNVKTRLLEYLGVLNLQYKVSEYKNAAQVDQTTVDVTPKITEKSRSKEIVFFEESKKQDEKSDNNQPLPQITRKKRFDVSKSPILCLAGPPGVGKTSLAKSVAATLGRKFQRISLGGVSDEAEIRGHRRTYVGAMPGVIISALRKAKTLNPVILLDEVDKIAGGGAGSGTRGDPSAAMLEVLDPEQNSSFNDHYLGFPVDLSQVLFFCTANDLSRLHPALRDRMEIIQIAGYNYFDKVQIVQRHLLPKQLSKNGLPKNALSIDENAILRIITEYTYSEPGIRNLERQVSKVCRNKALEFSGNLEHFTKENLEGIKLPQGYNSVILQEELPLYLGIPNSHTTMQQSQLTYSRFSEKYGIVNGLSYNSDGTGSTLLFEVVAIPQFSASPLQSASITPLEFDNRKSSPNSKLPGPIIMTGKLGQVLSESVKIALSVVQLILSKGLLPKPLHMGGPHFDVSYAEALETLQTHQLHLHAPEGAISKDGPSAGIAITLALLSLLLKKPVPDTIAMTGEMTLRGLVLPIGGVKEKILGAHLSKKVTTVLLPRSNRRDMIEDFVSNSKFLSGLKVGSERDKAKDRILIELLKRDRENVHNCAVFDKPEQYILETLGVRVFYVEDFWDVVEAVWDSERVKQRSEEGIRRLIVDDERLFSRL